jgi:hypothetical protein
MAAIAHSGRTANAIMTRTDRRPGVLADIENTLAEREKQYANLSDYIQVYHPSITRYPTPDARYPVHVHPLRVYAKTHLAAHKSILNTIQPLLIPHDATAQADSP